MKTDELNRFIEHIQFERRNPDTTQWEFFKHLQSRQSSPKMTIETHHSLFRARILGSDAKPDNVNFFGYEASKCLAPRPEKTRAGRANYSLIPALYCATNPILAAAETRALPGQAVSVALLRPERRLTILDITREPDWGIGSIPSEKYDLFSDLNEMYSKPASKDDDPAEYTPTQFIAEYIKQMGYDGIMYTSALHVHEQGNGASNVVLFDPHSCKAVMSIKLRAVASQFERADEGPEIDLDPRNFTFFSPNIR